MRVWEVEARGRHRTRGRHGVWQLSLSGEVRMVESFSSGYTFQRVKLEEPFEKVDSLGRGFGKDRAEGHFRIAWVLLLCGCSITL